MKHTLPLLALLVFLTACGGDDSPTIPTPAGPAYSQTDLVVGAGTSAMVNNFLTVSYAGWLHDASRPDGKGTQFDSGASFQFRLGTGAVIRGWDIGVAGMRVGGQRRLVIPPDLAYGSRGQGPIPPNATLVFDITLLNVQ